MNAAPSRDPLRPANGIGSTRAYQAARLRWALESDAPSLLALFRAAHRADGRSFREDEAEMHAWLEHGGAVLLEDEHGDPLCAVRWRFTAAGWEVGTVATREDAREQGYGRWLMTQLEALAIKRNVPTLTVQLQDRSRLPYYRRLGYAPAHEDEGEASSTLLTLTKRVGGTWQRQPGSVAPRSVA